MAGNFTVNFQIKALDKHEFDELAQLNDKALSRQSAQWILVDASPGYPCRVSLTDAEVGERVLALSYLHHDVESPYRASGPIFFREHALTAKLAINEIPQMLRHRLVSVRAYNAAAIMVGAEVVEGVELELAIARLFQQNDVEYIHIHNAKPGCFNCSVHRA
ncbi:DUF1203 domain-containing protein [Shewanella sp. SR44-3]|uniref:DUF1203 domain-containing protein n=1 Tax=unclassified Shewanella TaxID=196818 RepID=UPI0015FE5654|nr:DUF1203 domain-containing protein [Shewanella sp. SR44-3]MBB1268157.1 DUF1203 domain-containing protein [Shewanella sp. SR44-3]